MLSVFFATVADRNGKARKSCLLKEGLLTLRKTRYGKCFGSGSIRQLLSRPIWRHISILTAVPSAANGYVMTVSVQKKSGMTVYAKIVENDIEKIH